MKARRSGSPIGGKSGRPLSWASRLRAPLASIFGHAAHMDAQLKSWIFDPTPASLDGAPRDFAFQVRFLAGPSGGSGEESFDFTVCSPEWLASSCSRVGLYDARHHVVVNPERFDQRELVRWLHNRVDSISGDNWIKIASKLGRLGRWEFEDFTDEPEGARRLRQIRMFEKPSPSLWA